jgi:hypothetical protein
LFLIRIPCFFAKKELANTARQAKEGGSNVAVIVYEVQGLKEVA